jgi:apolipoprotein N-acyltransferase
MNVELDFMGRKSCRNFSVSISGFFFFFFFWIRIKLEVTIGDFGTILIFTFVLSSVIDLNNKEIDFVC